MGSRSLAHNVRLFNLEPRAAHGLCLNHSGELLALARTRHDVNGREEVAGNEEEAWIEIWNLRGGAPFFQRWLPTGESSLEAIAFGAKGRMYSTGLHGYILSHDIQSGAVSKSPVSWGASWCLDYHPLSKRIAVGTEEGVVCIFREESSGEIVYEKSLDKQEGRILSLAWEPLSGDKMVTGSTDTLRVWDTKTGHPLHRLSTARTFKGRETTVWSVAYLDNEVIISGDSRGKTSFWNGKTGTLLDSYQTHKADVLTVGVDRKQKIAYSTGVDPVVMYFQPILHKDGRSKWIKSIHRTVNQHDNRSIMPIGPKTIALTGIDSYLTLIESRSKYSYAPLPYGNAVSLSSAIRCLLFRYSNSLELWKLGETKDNLKNSLEVGNILEMGQNPVNLLKIENNDGRTIWCSDISDSGNFLAYAVQNSCRFYSLSVSPDEKVSPQLKRIKSQDKFSDTHHIKFIPNSNKCLLINNVGKLILLSILEEEDGMSLHKLKQIEQNQIKLTSSISKFDIEGEYIVLADFDDNVVVVNYETGDLVSHLPRYNHAPVSTVSISLHKTLVFITYSNGIVVECSVKSGKYTSFSNNFFTFDANNIIYSNDLRRTIRGAFYDPQNEDKIIMYDSSAVHIIDKCKVLENEKCDVKKLRTLGKSSKIKHISTDESVGFSIKTINNFDNLLFFTRIEKGVVAVEVLTNKLEDKLPPSFKVKKFGRT
uniref:Cirhinlike [Apis mellifera] n=1 Tax=Lepeophtheirus salmonis TaxID=72036 RepID=A0A0K2T9K3_LEPSM